MSFLRWVLERALLPVLLLAVLVALLLAGLWAAWLDRWEHRK